jgi:hypothetical protein
MFKTMSLKTISAVALSTSLLLGSLVALPMTSAFAKTKFDSNPTDNSRNSYRDRNIDNDGDELNESSEQPYVVIYTTYNRRADGKYTMHPAR